MTFKDVKLQASTECADMIFMLQGLSSADLLDKFPYKPYLSKLNLDDLDCLRRQMKAMDSIRAGSLDQTQQVIFTALSDSLLAAKPFRLATFAPDTALALLRWTEKISATAKSDAAHAVVWEALADFWFNHIANRLTEHQLNDKDLKADFRFKYLSQRLSEHGYNVNIRDSKLEKFKKNLVAGNWSHLISATWYDSAWHLRIAYAMIALLLLFGLSTVISLLAQYIKK